MPDLEQGAAADMPPFVTEGLLQGTLVATVTGWRAVEQISPGDLLPGFDDEPAEVVAVQSALIEAGKTGWPMAHWPLLVPDGALGNRGELRLLPGQTLLLDSDLAEVMFGDPFALVPAVALAGWRGIEPVAPAPLERSCLLLLSRGTLIYAAGQVLLFCPADMPDGLPDCLPEREGFLPLELGQARALVAALIAAEGSGAAEAAPPHDHAALRAVSP